MVVSTAIYASETWKSTRRIQKKLDEFCQRNLRKIMGVIWNNKVTNRRIEANWTEAAARHRTGERRLWFAGHVLWMAPGRPAHNTIDWIPVDGRKRRGRPRKTWRSTFCDDLHARGVKWSEAEELAADRVHWRNLYVAHCPEKGPDELSAAKC